MWRVRGGGEGPFYKVELQMTSGKPVGYPIAIGFFGCGCVTAGDIGSATSGPATTANTNAAGGWPVLTDTKLLWLRYGSEPPTEMQSPYEIFSGDPSINTNSHLYNTGASSLRRTVSTANLAEFTKFDETPLYFPAGSLTQQPTSRNSANAGNF